MTKEELMELWREMRQQRLDAGLPPPFEPSPIEFAQRVAKIAYQNGYHKASLDNGGYF